MSFNGQGPGFSFPSYLDPRCGFPLHSPTQDREYGIPQQPRIIIPPPLPQSAEHDTRRILELGFNNAGSNGPRKADFLQVVTRGHFFPRETACEWEYEERRVAQAILPFLYLGPVGAARDRDFLLNQGITMVMSVRDHASVQARMLQPKVATEMGLHVVNIDVRGPSQLVAKFPHAVDAINEHLLHRAQQGQQSSSTSSANDGHGKVLIFCETGNERSAAVAAAYLMAMYGVDYVQSIQVLQSQRFCVALDDNMRTLLRSYHDILLACRDINIDLSSLSLAGLQDEAKQDSMVIMPSHPSLNEKAPKRGIANLYNENEEKEVEWESDRLRFAERRDVAAPFAEDENE